MENREDTIMSRSRSYRRPMPAPRPRKGGTPRKASEPPADPCDDMIALGDLSGNLGYRLRRAQLWVFKDVSRRLARFDLSPAQYSVLTVIDANPGINQLAIASALDIERAGLGRLVDRLELQGLVMRTASVIHRRYYVLHLTAGGARLLNRVKPVVAQSEKALAERLGRTAYQDLLGVLSIFLNER
jgi:DNA-binding MarR family transcriptional regulator